MNFWIGVGAGLLLGLGWCFLVMLVTVRAARRGKCPVCDRVAR
jgi:hypothetical protein